MDYLVSREEMQAIDACNIKEFGIPGIVLMERAALAMADEISSRYGPEKRILVVAEKGNNGGDGLAVGRILLGRGYEVSFYEIGAINGGTESYRTQKTILENLKADFPDRLPDRDPDLIIDAIFGVGLSRDVSGVHREIIEELNRRQAVKIAVDTPSGVDASSGLIRGAAIRADLTVTFGFQKIGLLLWPGAECAGEVLVKDIGFMPESVRRISPRAYYYSREDLKDLPARSPWSNKGSYGKVLLIAGKRTMAGAALLAGRAAYRAGSGLVRIFTDEANRQIIQTGLPDAILSTYSVQEGKMSDNPMPDPTSCRDESDRIKKQKVISGPEGEDFDQVLKEALSWADVVGIGPGLGQTDFSHKLIKDVLRQGSCPLVADADAINCLSRLLPCDDEAKALFDGYGGGIILTPHLGEMARLAGRTIQEIREDRIGTARLFADRNHIVVLKDARTIVAGGGDGIYVNVSGNHGMSTGGSGDVLSGILCGLIAQGMPLRKAADLGVYCHGLAGDLAAGKKGMRGLMASDLPDALSEICG